MFSRREFLAKTGIATVVALLAGKVVLKPEVPAANASGTVTGRLWDPHTLVAADMYNVKPQYVTRDQRKTAKRITMMHMYGSAPSTLNEKNDVSGIVNLDLARAQRIVLDYYNYPPLPLPGHLKHKHKYVKGRSI